MRKRFQGWSSRLETKGSLCGFDASHFKQLMVVGLLFSSTGIAHWFSKGN